MANDSYGTFFSETRISYDPLWEGPLKKKRHCTNRFWLIAFCTFVIVWGIVAISAFSKGDIQKLIVPTDSEGRKCGVDLDVQDKPYLLFFDLAKCANGTCNTRQVCRSTCPIENFLYDPPPNPDTTALEEVKKKLICAIDINVNLITTWQQVNNYIDQEKCAKWYLKSSSIIKRCIPETPVPASFNSTITNDQINNATQIVMQIANVEKRLEEIYHDIVATGYPILGFIALSGVAAFLYIILLRWLAKPFVYASIIIICALLGYFIYESSVQYSVNNDSNWLYALIFCIILFIVVMLSTIFLRNQIDLACQIIKESSKAVGCIWSSLFFPIIPWILHFLVISLAVAILFYLKTITIPKYQVYIQENVSNSCVCPPLLNYINNATCDPKIFKSECKDANGGPCVSAGCYLSNTAVPGEVYIFHLINFSAFVWLSFFVSAFGQMVLSATFAAWYWTFNKRFLPSFTLAKSAWVTARYHVGTLAFGSLITWICDIIRYILKPISGGQTNGALSIQPIGCLRGFVEFLMSFLQYINHNAYIMCAIHGRGFCDSAKDAFNLITRSIARVVVITNITDWLLTIAKYFIVILTVSLTAMYYKNKGPDVIHGVEVPITMALIGSYLITSAFFTVHKTAVDTLFLCFLEDTERNDGSNDRPYYMSMRLKQLLNK